MLLTVYSIPFFLPKSSVYLWYVCQMSPKTRQFRCPDYLASNLWCAFRSCYSILPPMLRQSAPFPLAHNFLLTFPKPSSLITGNPHSFATSQFNHQTKSAPAQELDHFFLFTKGSPDSFIQHITEPQLSTLNLPRILICGVVFKTRSISWALVSGLTSRTLRPTKRGRRFLYLDSKRNGRKIYKYGGNKLHCMIYKYGGISTSEKNRHEI